MAMSSTNKNILGGLLGGAFLGLRGSRFEAPPEAEGFFSFLLRGFPHCPSAGFS